MTRSKFSIKAALLAGGIGLSMVAFAGSQPAAAHEYTCPAGTVYDPTYGCTVPDFAYDDYDGFDPAWGSVREIGHGFYHGFAHGMGTSVNHGASATVLRGFPSRDLGGDGFNHAMAGGISNVDHGLGFAHVGGGGFGHGIGAGFGHGMGGDHGMGFAHAGGFGHGMAGGFHGGGGGHR